MSREQTQRSPVALRDEPAGVLPAGPHPVAERLTALVLEARQERGARRDELTNAITSLLEGLPSEPHPQAVVPTLHRLLGEGLLEGLEDGSGQSATVAATRALLALGYPHALEVSPEQLAALKHWEGRGGPVPSGSILGVLFLAAVFQLALVTLGSPGIRDLFGASAAALAGEPMVEPAFWVKVERFIRRTEWEAFYAQLLLGGGAWVSTLVLGDHRDGLRWVRRALYALAVVGGLVGLAQLQVSGMVATGTFLSAGAALLSGRMLKP